jgi:hypothetical protein
MFSDLCITNFVYGLIKYQVIVNLRELAYKDILIYLNCSDVF